MKPFFYIWLARNFSVWSNNTSLITIEHANFPAGRSKNTNPSIDSTSSNTAFLISQSTRNHMKCDQHTKHPGFFNKGNTCYANSILQALSTIPSFWCQSASESGFLSPLTRAVTLNMSLLKRWTTPTFCGHLAGNCGPISRSLFSLTPNRMSLRSLKWFLLS